MSSLAIETYIKTLGKQIINESQESTSQHEAMKLFMQRTGRGKDEADQFVRVSLRNDLPTLRDKKAGKFTLGVTRMFLDRELNNADTITKLNKTLKYVASDAHINEYDRNLNGEAAQTLIDRFATAVKSDLNADKEELSKQSYNSKSEYDIVKIESFEDAEEYGDYVSWCVTHGEDMFDSYTSGGVNIFYFCLRDGFESEEETKGENCPLDSYGLSMIAVSVAPDGSLNTCTCRWNHSNGGNDSIMNTKQISQAIGMNFYSVFKGNEEYLGLVDTCKKLGVNVQDLEFNNCGFAICKNQNSSECFIVDKYGKILMKDISIDHAYNITDYDNGEDMICIECDGEYNFINSDGKLVSPDVWFDDVDECNDCGIPVVKNGKYNLVIYDGLLSRNLWFDGIDYFENCPFFIKVLIGNKWNILNYVGKIVSPNVWFDKIFGIKGDFILVSKDDKYNFVSFRTGKLISPNKWFDDVGLKVMKYTNVFHVKIDNIWCYAGYNGHFYDEDGNEINI